MGNRFADFDLEEKEALAKALVAFIEEHDIFENLLDELNDEIYRTETM